MLLDYDVKKYCYFLFRYVFDKIGPEFVMSLRKHSLRYMYYIILFGTWKTTDILTRINIIYNININNI